MRRLGHWGLPEQKRCFMEIRLYMLQSQFKFSGAYTNKLEMGRGEKYKFCSLKLNFNKPASFVEFTGLHISVGSEECSFVTG